MIDQIQAKKSELKAKADQYGEFLKQEYSGSAAGSSAFSGIGLIGGGLILAISLVIRYLSPGEENPAETGSETYNTPTSKDETVFNSDSRNEFREKLTIVILEIIRQALLALISKYNLSDDKAGLQ
ncbi:MAG TPA: hypothetical protein VI583_10235 [Cyclobacteriaceae bacterium]|nr:hypothetical protein [Cyclobacteriaceae bacterium]